MQVFRLSRLNKDTYLIKMSTCQLSNAYGSDRLLYFQCQYSTRSPIKLYITKDALTYNGIFDNYRNELNTKRHIIIRDYYNEYTKKVIERWTKSPLSRAEINAVYEDVIECNEESIGSHVLIEVLKNTLLLF
jgi:hypothetical protein